MRFRSALSATNGRTTTALPAREARGERHGEGTADTRAARDRDCSTVELDQGLGDRQTQPHAVDRVAQPMVRPVGAREEACLLGLAEPNPRVAY